MHELSGWLRELQNSLQASFYDPSRPVERLMEERLIIFTSSLSKKSSDLTFIASTSASNMPAPRIPILEQEKAHGY
jgi:hypothetical protein